MVEMAAPAGMAGVPGSGAAGTFVRRGEAVVDGFGCVEWDTTDRTGKPADVCITSDGVLLRASAQGQTLVSASSVDKDGKSKGGNVAAAKAIGKLVAERAKEKGIKSVVFDRGGYPYHGRVKALADAAREAGLEF